MKPITVYGNKTLYLKSLIESDRICCFLEWFGHILTSKSEWAKMYLTRTVA